MSDEITTFIRPEYRLGSGRPIVVNGVTFRPYITGILRYARISDDGQIMVKDNIHANSCSVFVIGHGPLLSRTGHPTRFRYESTAFAAGVAVFKKLQAERAK